MPATLNHHLVQATKFDSGAVSQLMAVLHRVDQPGIYRLVVTDNQRSVTVAALECVSKDGPQQLNVDLADLAGGSFHPNGPRGDCGCSKAGNPALRVATGGLLQFFVSRGAGGFRVTLSGFEANAKPLFDSGALGEKDGVVFQLIRPGEYTLTAPPAKPRVAITVPRVRENEKITPEAGAAMLAASGHGFTMQSQPIDRVQLKPLQPLFVQGIAGARLIVELTKADDADGSPDRRPRPHTWTRTRLLNPRTEERR